MLRRLFSTSTNGLDKVEVIHPYQPVPRWGHSAASINGKLYVWGGCMENLPKVHSSTEKTSVLSQIEIFDPQTLLWEYRMTSGSPPLGVYWNAYTNTDKHLYTFGGYCGHGNCYHNSVHQLDVTALQWREVMAVNPSDAPMKKWQCGMVSFTQKDTDFLCVFGGWGLLSASHKSTKHEFIADRSNLGCVWSNELHFFNLTKGTWDCPATTGSRPPPCQGFTFTKVDSDRVIIFGGFQPATRRRVNDVYILNLQTRHWIRLYNGIDPTVEWPVGRDDHSACIKNGTSPLFLTLGGVNNQFNTLADLWIMDVDSGKWKQVSAPQVVVGRRGHSTMVFSLAPRHFLLVIYGGIYEWVAEKSHREQPVVTETAVVELFESEGGDWKVMCDERVADPPLPATPTNKQQQLNGHERRHLMENGFRHSSTDLRQLSPRDERKSKKNRVNTMTLDRRAGTVKQLEEAKKEIKMLQGQLIDAMNIVKKVRRSGEEAEAKSVQLDKKIEQMTKDLSEMQTKLSSSEDKMLQAQKTINEQRKEIETLKKKSASPEPLNNTSTSTTSPEESLQQLWAVSPSDIQLTQAELSRDSWSSVYVGSLRGLHVAARCYKDGGSLNEGIYHKAITSSLKVRHPNILQFIGGTPTGINPIILTELMPTTLRMTLRQGPLPKRQILSIASDISGALHYIHQLGIIHRDVNTTNILLEPIGNNAWKAKLSDCASSIFTSYLKLSSCSSPHPSSPSYNALSIFSAPEAKAPELYSPKTDIYGFGIILLEMCQPSEGIASVTNGDLRPRLQRLGWPAMTSLVRACTYPAPSDRPSSFEVLQRLNSGGNSPPVVNSESLV